MALLKDQGLSEYIAKIENFPSTYDFDQYFNKLNINTPPNFRDGQSIVCKFNSIIERDNFVCKLNGRMVDQKTLTLQSFNKIKNSENSTLPKEIEIIAKINNNIDINILLRDSNLKITHLYDCYTFAAQLESDILELKFIENNMISEFNNTIIPTSLIKGEHYICQREKKYFRGLCVNAHPEEGEFLLIDYGYTKLFPLKKVAPFPKHMDNLAKCHIYRIDKIIPISDKIAEATEYMKQYVNKILGFQFRRIENGIYYIILVDGIYNVHVKMIKQGLFIFKST